MAKADSSSSDGDTSPESASSLATIAENLQRSAIQSARTVQHSSTTQFHAFQNSLPKAASQYRKYEDAFFNKVKDGLMIAKENPALTAGVAISTALLVMRATQPSKTNAVADIPLTMLLLLLFA